MTSEEQAASTPPSVEDDHVVCPIPTTHRRLADAHVLWHQALDSYGDPERFRANLNATFEALRNITFAVQTEHGAFGDFQAWYAPWQARLKADAMAVWAKDSRNLVVHQGALETDSKAVVRLLTWKDDVLAEIEAPPLTPSSVLLSNVPLVKLIADAKVPESDAADAAVTVERRWSVPELQGREILDAIAQVYGLLSELVLDAHLHLGRSACIARAPKHPNFVSKYDRTGTLECMAVAVEQRTNRFTLRGEAIFSANAARQSCVTPEDAAARYGMQYGDKASDWEASDPLLLANRILFQAKRVLRRDRFHTRLVFLRDGRSQWHQLAFLPRDRTEKHLLVRMVASFMERVGADALIDVGEIWTLPEEQLASAQVNLSSLEGTPGRGEALQVLVATREGALRNFITPFRRGLMGGIKLGETITIDNEYLYYLRPIFEVWRRQGAVAVGEGKYVRRIWEPDPLDICFCGRSRRFAECCRPEVDAAEDAFYLTAQFKRAAAEENWIEAERYASAALAQYVIWIKQHTAPTRHVADELHRRIIEVDMPALETLVDDLEVALDHDDRSQDTFRDRLRNVSRVVGVPELSARLTAVAAGHALRQGDRLGAVEELERLGDLDRVKDTLALLIAADVYPSNHKDKLGFLQRARGAAITPVERATAELHLGRYLADRDESKALSHLAAAVVEARKQRGTEGLVADVLIERWRVTDTDEDFMAARQALEALDSAVHRRRLALLLFEREAYPEAEKILEQLDDDPVAAILRVEIPLRSNKPDQAKAALTRIRTDTLPPGLRYPYAHTMALVAMATQDVDLQRTALQELLALQPGLPETSELTSMIATLRSSLERNS